VGARQLTLAGDVAGACSVPGWCLGWFPAVVAGMVMSCPAGSVLLTGWAAPRAGPGGRAARPPWTGQAAARALLPGRHADQSDQMPAVWVHEVGYWPMGNCWIPR
jgi:hypothetical protein